MKMGTIGTGMITEWLNTAFEDNGLECTAVYSRKEETGRRLADKYNMPKVYTDLNAMLHDEELDCIYIASPNSLHYSQAIKALEAGKNVILEKPFVSTIEECRTLIETAKKHHRFLFEAITVPYNPNYQVIQERIAELGSLKMVQCNFSQYSSKFDKFKNNENPNVFNPQFSGGALMDINIYNAHFIIGLFGAPKSLKYVPNIAANGIDTSGILVFDYDGFLACGIGCKDSASENICQLQGDNGYIVVHSASSVCAKAEVWLKCAKEPEVIDLMEGHGGHYFEVKNFKQMIENEDYEGCYQKLEYSYQVMELVHTARLAAGVRFAADQK